MTASRQRKQQVDKEAYRRLKSKADRMPFTSEKKKTFVF
jgi:hypothetical protein